MKILKKVFAKKWVKVVVGIAGAIFALYLAIIIPEIWKSYQWQKSVDRFQSALEKPYREDVYGGATPEETWGMFLDALKNGDIDLASKYFVVRKQKEWQDILSTLKDQNELSTAIQEFETLQKDDESADPLNIPGKLYYHIKAATKEFGEISSPVVFYLNPYTKVWKILVL